ncbi:hypothetical protein DICPUDRAFT_150706 [Dictyostelium purpureum]|uniref:Uncharacterized protein n=1 Tax=Dictyostelium purpureum TaxID=5786 RepID=F0ZH16_DICPU|nr:uncharacterized protein DICPUDRAFT_150706 [Dictyostelium purpureum]EGC36776.1 hypothetical protein DICPUDRAFT_150706 [Dictyostelium purpureum]|eukprot:XP_003286722.1 hypothetical protein DICPUDRAFT_150706 [Dictyostelium purpureum]
MATLKEVTPSIVKYVNDMWEKSLTTGQGANTATPENPIHPFVITSVQQVQPSRQQMELFETRRNQLDKLMPAGKKLETFTCFYNPTSEGQLKKIIQSSWKEVFGGNPDQLTFITNANEAANINRVQYYRTIVVRVCLGREGVDYSQPSKGHIKIRDLDGVSTSFVVTYRNSNDPASHLQSPLKDSTSSLSSSSSSVGSAPSSANSTPTKTSVTSVASPNKSTTPAGVTPGGLIGDGINCPSCKRSNPGNTRYCLRCGSNL